ncbi:MAG TPA: hypothetical protein VHP11_16355 [Tepidisphaeraceae bacterium]|nr:hypothetical protein [Tepidisphaeraceae bacterium]
MIIMACFIAPAQRVAVFSLNFTLLRILVLFGTVRILSRHEWMGFRWNSLDTVLVAWTICGTIAYTFLFGSAEALKFKLGTSYDAVGMYFLFRCLVREWADIERATLGFVFVSVPVLAAFLIERATRHNLFAFLGGVPAITLEREGRLRCQGAFAHPILAGCFWASVMPLIAALWWRGGQSRWLATVGLAASGLIVVLCASSTPVAAAGGGLVGLCMFPLRRQMRPILWGSVALLATLHLVMKAPVWHLIARIDLAGGSTGWHRANLITQAINHFDEWWLLGVRSIASWGVWKGDVTNQYLLEGVRGGAATAILFITMIWLAFRRVGALCRSVGEDRYHLIVAWTLGVALFVHAVSFIAVNYFGQIWMVFFLQLAMPASLPTSRASMVNASPRRLLQAQSVGLNLQGTSKEGASAPQGHSSNRRVPPPVASPSAGCPR